MAPANEGDYWQAQGSSKGNLARKGVDWKAEESQNIRENHTALGGSCATHGCLASLFVNVSETDLGILIMDYCQFLLELGFLSPPSPQKINVGEKHNIQLTVASGT